MNLRDYLDITQLFAAGLGFDIAGVWLLARGLLASNDEIARRTASYIGQNPWATVTEVSDRADAKIGVAALVGGFSIQAAAYVATLALDTTIRNSHEKAVFALAATGLAIGVVVLAARLLRPRLVYPALADLARIDH